MLRYFFLILAFLILVTVAISGLRGQKFTKPPIEIFPDMDNQPKVKAQVPSDFFADGRGAREPVAGTVPLGFAMPQHKPTEGSDGLNPSPYRNIQFSGGLDYANTGKMASGWGTGIPVEVTSAFMERGRERFNISCAICHGETGAGNGMAYKFGLGTVQSLLQERIRVMPDGEIFNTITHGKNTMMSYGDRIQVQDRWAIIAYLRALQKSQGGATLNDVPPDERAKLEVP